MRISKGEIAKFAGNADYLIISLANYDYLPMIKNWIYFIRKLHINNYVVFALDKKLYDELKKLNISTYFLKTDKPLSREVPSYGSVEFKKVTRMKLEITYKLLKEGLSILVSDLDTIWLSNPMEYMGLDSDFDIQIQFESRGFDIDDPFQGRLYNTGLYYARSNKKTIRLFKNALNDMKRYLENSPDNIPNREDQYFFNKVIRTNKDWVSVSTSGSINIRDKTKLQLRVLDPVRFPNGHSYFKGGKDFRKRKIKPVVIHANFLATINEKIEALKKFNYWHSEKIG